MIKAKPMELCPGREVTIPPPPEEIEHREEILRATVAKYLPEMMKAVHMCAKENDKPIKQRAHFMFHQDAFAASYDVDEYILLGMAVKYAGLFGVNTMIISER